MEDPEIMAYRREDGSVGVRNHVALIAVDHAGAVVVEGTAKLLRGVEAVSHQYGRLQFGEDLELTFETLIGVGCNPNVAASVVVGIEPNWTVKIAEEIEKRSRKPVEAVWVIGQGTISAIEETAKKARKLVSWASELKKETHNLSDLVIGVKCGASDTTSGIAANPAIGRFGEWFVDSGGTFIFGETTELAGGEHIVASRFESEEERMKFLKVYNDYVEFAKSKGADILGSQPTQENIAGGLTTIEEKALGNIQKVPNRPIKGVLKPAEKPKGKGVWFMDTSSSAQEQVTLLAAAGAAIHLFSTGKGNTVGNQIVPVVKITGNPITAREMEDNIDVDVSGITMGSISLDEGARKLYEFTAKVASGKLTAAEILRHDNFTITRLYPSM
jgi:(2R)-sulfolactate sulfo-lyase subunit beta